MIAPRWIDTRTQPVAVRDVVEALPALADLDDPPHEVQLGGADVLTYREMMLRYARVAGRRLPSWSASPSSPPSSPPTGSASSRRSRRAWPRPLVQGLSAEMLVRSPPPAGVNDDPLGFEEGVREALDEVREPAAA